MYYIIILIILSVIIVELYSVFKNFKIEKDKNNYIDKSGKELMDVVKFDEYVVKEDKIIKLSPGKLLIKDNQNLFIQYHDDIIFMKPGIIYTFENPFEIEVVNITGENILYYYTRI